MQYSKKQDAETGLCAHMPCMLDILLHGVHQLQYNAALCKAVCTQGEIAKSVVKINLWMLTMYR